MLGAVAVLGAVDSAGDPFRKNCSNGPSSSCWLLRIVSLTVALKNPLSGSLVCLCARDFENTDDGKFHSEAVFTDQNTTLYTHAFYLMGRAESAPRVRRFFLWCLELGLCSV